MSCKPSSKFSDELSQALSLLRDITGTFALFQTTRPNKHRETRGRTAQLQDLLEVLETPPAPAAQIFPNKCSTRPPQNNIPRVLPPLSLILLFALLFSPTVVLPLARPAVSIRFGRHFVNKRRLLFLLSRACCQARDGASHFFLYTSND